MIIACHIKDGFKSEEITKRNKSLLKDALWIDLIAPTFEEEALIEQCLGLNIPTREEMLEIELSSRLYKDGDVLFMTASMIAQAESADPKLDAVTFVLTKKQLITIRYIEPQSFKVFTQRAQKLKGQVSVASFLTELLDATIDRLADILEMVSHQLEDYSKAVFKSKSSNHKNYHDLLGKLSSNGDLNSKIVESLVSFGRVISFFAQSKSIKMNDSALLRLKTLNKDIGSLSDHASFISQKISFLLEATLGMVQIDQNAIIKIFSVAAVIFLPPTLVASIYGMNFNLMPELSWKYGYLLALCFMVFSSWLPYRYFKYRKWL